MRILVLGGISRSLLNFRGKMLEAMVAQGHEVTCCAGEVETDVVEQLKGMGVGFHGVELRRRGTNALGDWRYYRALRQVIAKVKPDVVLAYTIKPVVYGCLAAARANVPTVAAMITGAGAAQPGATAKESAIAWIVQRLYRRALRRTDVVFFQNPDDEAMFRQCGLIKNHRVVQIAGSGVDLSHYAPAPPVTDPVTFLLIARLLQAKGIREYVTAATSLSERYGRRVLCVLVGPFEDGGEISSEELARWRRGAIDYRGALDDVRPALREASVYVLPSYREGTPRTVLEAMAMGRAIITTDAPGCRQTVVEGENGYLVPPKDAQALEDAMRRFVEAPELIVKMGQQSRRLAECRFDVHLVNRTILAALQLA